MNNPKTPITPMKQLKVVCRINDASSFKMEHSSANTKDIYMMRNEPISSKTEHYTDSSIRLQIQHYLHTVSGQLKKPTQQEIEHSYSKPWNVHPDPQIRSQASKFLFMKHFPQHLTKLSNQLCNDDDELIDVVSCEDVKKIPFLTPKPPPQPIHVDEDEPEIDSSITDSWTCEKNRLWTRATKIIFSDRVARLTFEGNANEVLLKRNLLEQTAQKFRELFASTFWDFQLITWLHQILLKHLNPTYQSVYIESLNILQHKIPSLIYQFYVPQMDHNKNNNNKATSNDPLFNTLSHYKPKKLPRKPIIILVPSAPSHHAPPSPRLKYWISLLSSMSKLITLTVQAKPTDYISDILENIRTLVNDKIQHCRAHYPTRPIVLLGFNSASLIAAHCALQNPQSIAAIICLGFALKTISGCRGELGDPLLDLTCPIQFIIGENSIQASLDDMEDFREKMSKTETSLIVVGGADDKLVVSNVKKRLECLTQSMVDRCVADEIFDFLSPILSSYSQDDFTSMMNNYKTYKSSSLADFCQSSTGSSKKRSRKRTKTNDIIPYDPANPGMFIEKPIPKRKKTKARSKTDEGPDGVLDKSTANSLVNLSQIYPSFTIVPFQSQVSSNMATIVSTDCNDKSLFSNIKINQSKIITFDSSADKPSSNLNQFKHSPLTQKVVKKTLKTLPPIGANLINVKHLFPNDNIKTYQLNHVSNPGASNSCGQSSTESSLKNPIIFSSQADNFLSNYKIPLISHNKSNQSTTVSTASDVSGSSGSATSDLKNTLPTTNNGNLHPTDSTSLNLQASTSRTGRQIKPPKPLDF